MSKYQQKQYRKANKERMKQARRRRNAIKKIDASMAEVGQYYSPEVQSIMRAQALKMLIK